MLLRTEAGRSIFADEGGEPHAPGTRFRQTELAETLRGAAKDGAAYFYTGEWAEHFVSTVRAEGGKISLEDLAQYRPHWQEPATVDFQGTSVHGMPLPNRGGSSVVLALGLAQAAGLHGEEDPAQRASALYRLASIEQAVSVTWSRRGREALAKHVPGIESLWQPPFGDAPSTEKLWQSVQSPLWSKVLEDSGRAQNTGGHSDSIVAVDHHGNVVALIHTINTAGWGTSGIFVDGVSIPDSAASQQSWMRAVGPGGRMPDHGVPLIGTQGGRPVFASSATGSGNVQASWQNAIRILGCGRTPAEVAGGPNLYAGQVQRRDVPAERIEAVRKLGFPLRSVEGFGNFERGYWVGATFEPESGRMNAACLRSLSGIAVGE